jgi:hypothetical protein
MALPGVVVKPSWVSWFRVAVRWLVIHGSVSAVSRYCWLVIVAACAPATVRVRVCPSGLVWEETVYCGSAAGAW